jgi:hypothetical protein
VEIFNNMIKDVVSAYVKEPTLLVSNVLTTVQTLKINPPNDGKSYPILIYMGFFCDKIANVTWYMQRVGSISEIVAYGSNPIIFCDNQPYRMDGWTYNLRVGLVKGAPNTTISYKSAIAMVTKR